VHGRLRFTDELAGASLCGVALRNIGGGTSETLRDLSQADNGMRRRTALKNCGLRHDERRLIPW